MSIALGIWRMKAAPWGAPSVAPAGRRVRVPPRRSAIPWLNLKCSLEVIDHNDGTMRNKLRKQHRAPIARCREV